MRLEEIKKIANEIVEIINPYCEKVEICGSIRRKRPNPRDIDIVVLPKFLNKHMLIEKLEKSGASFRKKGENLASGSFKSINFDLYFARKDNFEVLKLIRTGSAKHNILLCSLAKRKGWKLSASDGLFDSNGKLISNTEEGILKALLGKWIPPEERM